MRNLIPFQNTAAPAQVQSETVWLFPNLLAQFFIQDLENRLQLPTSFELSGSQVPRADELWKGTCFEVFLQPEGGSSYYEFNFSLKPAWNLYTFERYREPQPPKPSQDFQLRAMKWDKGILTCDLYTTKEFAGLKFGLTAVLREPSGAVHYLALHHVGTKPDFHRPESFTLKKP
ncbi:MAG: hypothetical protein ACK5Y2_13655 [Bdellovibrionales bacterium]